MRIALSQTVRQIKSSQRPKYDLRSVTLGRGVAEPLETSPSPRYITVPNLVAVNSMSVRKARKAVGTRRLCTLQTVLCYFFQPCYWVCHRPVQIRIFRSCTLSAPTESDTESTDPALSTRKWRRSCSSEANEKIQ